MSIQELRSKLITLSMDTESYTPLSDQYLNQTQNEIDQLLVESLREGTDQISAITNLISLILSHYDVVRILLSKRLDKMPFEVVEAIASSLLIDSGFFGSSEIVSIFFTPSSGLDERVHCWERSTIPDLNATMREFLMREDIPTDILQEIESAIPSLKKSKD